MDRMLDPALDVGNGAPCVALVPSPVESFGGEASWTTRLSLKSTGSASPRFSFHSRISAASSGLMMILASEPPMKSRRFTFFAAISKPLKSPKANSMTFSCSGRIVGAIRGLDVSVQRAIPIGDVVIPQG
jgi:hypothetical protein